MIVSKKCTRKGVFFILSKKGVMCLSKKLTLRQQCFADEYIISGNIYQSAIKAGYSDNYASRRGYQLLENVGIKDYIDERLKILDEQKIAKQGEVLKYLTSVMRGESKSEEVMQVSVGNGANKIVKLTKAPSEKEKLKAAELLGKVHGIFDTSIKFEGAVPVVISGGDDLED